MAWGQSGRRAGVAATNWKGKACIRNNRRQQQSTHVFIFMPMLIFVLVSMPMLIFVLVSMLILMLVFMLVLIPELRKLDPQLND